MEGADLHIEPRRNLSRAWRDGEPSGVDLDLGKMDDLKRSMAEEAAREKRGEPLSHGKRSWARKLREAMPGLPQPSVAEWAHGLHDRMAEASGPRVVYASPTSARCLGAERWWFDQGASDEVNGSGWYADWEARAAQLHRTFCTDEAGYVCWRDHARVTEAELGELPPMIQLHARARLALGEEVPLVSGPPKKWSTRHVNVDVAASSLHEACVWQARLRIEEAYTMDGGKVEVALDKGQVTVIAYAAIRHDGKRLGGVITDSKIDPYVPELDLPGTSYLAELAAQVRVSLEAGDQGHVFVYYDARSPADAIASYRKAHPRQP